MHVRIRQAVMDEMAHPNHCPECGGRGEVMQGKLLIRCRECRGNGVVPVSDRTRAKKIGKCESTYRRVWCGMYEWLFAQISDAEGSAAAAMRRALSDEYSQAPALVAAH